MQVHVVGYYGMNNVGDEAFRPAMSYIFDGHSTDFINIDVYRNSSLPTPDVLVLGGGDVVTPYYLPVISGSSCKTKIGLGVGLGYESESELAAKSNLSAWFLRNREDVSLVKDKTNVPVDFTPDLAFHLKPSGNKILERYLPSGKGKVVAILLTDYLMPSAKRNEEFFWNRGKNFVKHFGAFCTRLVESGYNIIMLPCSGDGHADDRRVHMSVRAHTFGNVTCVHDLLSPQDMIDVLAEVDFCICQRFHSHVFAMIANTPLMSVSFTRKVKKLLEAAGGGVHTNCFDQTGNYVEVDLMGSFDKMTREAEQMKSCFSVYAQNNRLSLSDVKQKVLQLIG
jgi:polysaccharide pyruvyl transferase WcaK-like protein